MTQLATFGAGCFWCYEPSFQALKGVLKVRPGYAGGHKDNPTYEEVCTGKTGHTECVRIEFDDEIIRYEELLQAFFFVHDPTQLNRQGNDIGIQYRSVIFYHSEEQKEIAEKIIQQLTDAKVYSAPIVTTVEPLTSYFEAENYHHDYVAQHPENPYCQYVSKPKIEKFRHAFAEKLK